MEGVVERGSCRSRQRKPTRRSTWPCREAIVPRSAAKPNGLRFSRAMPAAGDCSPVQWVWISHEVLCRAPEGNRIREKSRFDGIAPGAFRNSVPIPEWITTVSGTLINLHTPYNKRKCIRNARNSIPFLGYMLSGDRFASVWAGNYHPGMRGRGPEGGPAARQAPSRTAGPGAVLPRRTPPDAGFGHPGTRLCCPVPRR